MPKSNLKDVVVASANYSLSISEEGTVCVLYQKQLNDDAPGDAQDQVIDVGELKTLWLSDELAAKVITAVNDIVEYAINENESKLGETTTNEDPGPPAPPENGE
ncbi:MAG TPA: hypothetical protein PL045_03715 [Chitinophagaceae bacterium]|nr:hypothetical protein [Chitinophagaceae bacterium]